MEYGRMEDERARRRGRMHTIIHYKKKRFIKFLTRGVLFSWCGGFFQSSTPTQTPQG